SFFLFWPDRRLPRLRPVGNLLSRDRQRSLRLLGPAILVVALPCGGLRARAPCQRLAGPPPVWSGVAQGTCHLAGTGGSRGCLRDRIRYELRLVSRPAATTGPDPRRPAVFGASS